MASRPRACPVPLEALEDRLTPSGLALSLPLPPVANLSASEGPPATPVSDTKALTVSLSPGVSLSARVGPLAIQVGTNAADSQAATGTPLPQHDLLEPVAGPPVRLASSPAGTKPSGGTSSPTLPPLAGILGLNTSGSLPPTTGAGETLTEPPADLLAVSREGTPTGAPLSLPTAPEWDLLRPDSRLPLAEFLATPPVGVAGPATPVEDGWSPAFRVSGPVARLVPSGDLLVGPGAASAAPGADASLVGRAQPEAVPERGDGVAEGDGGAPDLGDDGLVEAFGVAIPGDSSQAPGEEVPGSSGPGDGTARLLLVGGLVAGAGAAAFYARPRRDGEPPLEVDPRLAPMG